MLCWRFPALYNIGSHLPFLPFFFLYYALYFVCVSFTRVLCLLLKARGVRIRHQYRCPTWYRCWTTFSHEATRTTAVAEEEEGLAGTASTRRCRVYASVDSCRGHAQHTGLVCSDTVDGFFDVTGRPRAIWIRPVNSKNIQKIEIEIIL